AKTIVFEDEWPKIRPVVLKLLNQETVTKQEWQDLFWTVHNLNSWSDKAPVSIQKALEMEIGDFIDSARQRILIHEDSQSLLRAYINEWQKFYDQSLYLFEPFRMIDGSSSGGHSSSSSVYRRSSPLPSRSGVLAKKSHEESISLSCDSNDRLSIYRQYFEKSYLESTENYYRSRASIFLHENGVQAYTRYVDQKLIEEEERGRQNGHLMNNKTAKNVNPLSGMAMSVKENVFKKTINFKQETAINVSQKYRKCQKILMEKCVEILLCAFQDQILAECSILIRNLEIDRLRLMFRLMNRTPTGIDVMLKRLEDHIREQGLVDMLQNAGCIVSDPEKYVEQLLSMFSKFSRLVKGAFYDDPRFLTSRDKAFQDVVNDTSIFRLEINNSCSTPSHSTKSPI
uniref:Cullin-5 n=1 Tax=Romanomermis culicivorax TaxID=13658 RepID=A0A915JHE6_ROMCU